MNQAQIAGRTASRSYFRLVRRVASPRWPVRRCHLFGLVVSANLASFEPASCPSDAQSGEAKQRGRRAGLGNVLNHFQIVVGVWRTQNDALRFRLGLGINSGESREADCKYAKAAFHCE